MASQTPQINQQQLSYNPAGFPRPNLLQTPPTMNGTASAPNLSGVPSGGTPQPGMFPHSNRSAILGQQWNRPPIPGQSSAFSPLPPATRMQQPHSFAPPTYNPSAAISPKPPPSSAISGSPVISSEPPSNHTSQNPSPTPPQFTNSRFDNLEGQFSSGSGAASPDSGTTQNHFATPNTNGMPHVNGTQYPPSSVPDASIIYTTNRPAGNQILPPTSGPLSFQQQSAQRPGPPTSGGIAPPPMAPTSNFNYSAPNMNGAVQPPPNPAAPWATPAAYPPMRPSYPAHQGQQMPPPQPSMMDPRRPYPQPGPQTSFQPSGQQNFNQTINALSSQVSSLSVAQSGFDKIWGYENVDLLQVRHILPPQGVEVPSVRLRQEHLNQVNCNPDIFRCTLTKIPETSSILQKSRLPLGILIHPFKDLTQLPVIQCQTIVRCRTCRTYINPFVYFVDQRRWKCNLCFRVNDLPDEFQYDPMTNSYGDPSRRPEIKNATIEFIAPAEYMLRPPQPPVYLYLLDVSHSAVDTGYLKLFCDVLLEELDKIPGDLRTKIGFITYDSSIHFYNLAEGLNQPHQLIVTDIDDVFLPCPEDLLVTLNESKQLVIDLLEQLPTKFNNTHETNSALGAALQAAYKLISPTGGRVTVFHASLPNAGPGELKSREDPNQRAGKDVPNLNPATDFYKKLALDCSGQQVAVDLFLLGGQYMDIASLSCISKYSGGCIYHFPGFHYIHNLLQVERLERSFRRYLTRKIGFESVMRIRCTRGLAIHTFHGNFFVRSTDLLSLPNINPDAGFGLQVSIEENLNEVQNICFQAALLYTSSKAERRIRVHTLCLPIASTVAEVIQSADQQCIVGLLAKMAVDRSMQSSIGDARDALINVCVDVLSAYKATQSSVPQGLSAPVNLRLLPLYVAALLKTVALRTGQSTRLDERVFAMNQLKVLPLSQLMLLIYPDLYAIHNLNDQGAISQEELVIPQPPRLHLSAEMIDSKGAYLMDTGDVMYLYVGRSVSPVFLENALGSPSFHALPEQMFELPELDTNESERLRNFVTYLQNQRPFPTVLQLIREDSKIRHFFTGYLVDGRTESSLSYYEFLQHLKNQVK